jgi:hypothetical protein
LGGGKVFVALELDEAAFSPAFIPPLDPDVLDAAAAGIASDCSCYVDEFVAYW